jgi:WD40 repeat protein
LSVAGGREVAMNLDLRPVLCRVVAGLGLLCGVPPASAQEPKRNTFQGHRGTVMSVSFSPDGQTLASGSRDEAIRLSDVWRPGRPPPPWRGTRATSTPCRSARKHNSPGYGNLFGA